MIKFTQTAAIEQDSGLCRLLLQQWKFLKRDNEVSVNTCRGWLKGFANPKFSYPAIREELLFLNKMTYYYD